MILQCATSLRLQILGFSVSILDISQRKRIWPENESLQKHQEHQDLVSLRGAKTSNKQIRSPPIFQCHFGCVLEKK